jgi:arsenate reductase
MAEGFLKSFDRKLSVYSAGTDPGSKVHHVAIRVMQEAGIDISNEYPKSVNKFLNESFDYVITVCDGANEKCPVFIGKVINRLHIGFDDPAEVKGTEEHILSEFRRVRDKIYQDFKKFYDNNLKRK